MRLTRLLVWSNELAFLWPTCGFLLTVSAYAVWPWGVSANRKSDQILIGATVFFAFLQSAKAPIGSRRHVVPIRASVFQEVALHFAVRIRSVDFVNVRLVSFAEI